ncbi:MAG TPA: hypothetical protein VK988_07655 [Acidimicrobiales bacterium]|nr:hypothetical protein [Acidimicrobiales bacterium]
MTQEIPPLPESTILLVEVGSTAHGTGLPGGEDHDEMGVVVEGAAVVLALYEHGFRTVMQRTQPEGDRGRVTPTERSTPCGGFCDSPPPGIRRSSWRCGHPSCT